MDVDINQLFNKVTESDPKQPQTFAITLEDSKLTELFEFLLEFFTMLCKHFYGDSQGQVNLQMLTPIDLLKINKYMASIGFTCIFTQVPANFENTQYYSQNRYDRIPITPTTILPELFFALRCGNLLNIINFAIC
jgi:hypothetical protein